MQVKQLVASAAIAGTLGMGGLALAGTASASPSTAPNGQGGNETSITTTRTNVLSGNNFVALNGTRILSGNTVKLNVTVVAFNGNFSGNAVNSPGAFNSSTNITKTWQSFFNSFNTTTVNKTTTTNTTVNTTTNTGGSCQGNCAPNGQGGNES